MWCAVWPDALILLYFIVHFFFMATPWTQQLRPTVTNSYFTGLGVMSWIQFIAIKSCALNYLASTNGLQRASQTSSASAPSVSSDARLLRRARRH